MPGDTSVPNDGYRRLLILLGFALVVAIALTVVGIVFADEKGSEVALEAAKAGIGLGAVTIFGALVTQGFRGYNDARERRQKEIDVEREERERLNEYRLEVFRDTVQAYNDVKRVRRSLRAAGLDRLGGKALSEAQLAAYEAGMVALDDAELTLERIGREVSARTVAFPHAANELPGLNTSYRYLKDVLGVWERGEFPAVTSDDSRTGPTKFEDFLMKRSEACDQTFWPAFDAFEGAIRADMIERKGATGPSSGTGP